MPQKEPTPHHADLSDCNGNRIDSQVEPASLLIVHGDAPVLHADDGDEGDDQPDIGDDDGASGADECGDFYVVPFDYWASPDEPAPPLFDVSWT
jgi:hypothetical protein